MIKIYTGIPGSGKTQRLIADALKLSKADHRPVFYYGIDKLKIPEWTQLDKPEDWYKCPPNSIVLIDEAQRIFRPRGNGAAVPEYVAALETHRHSGIDLWCTTQHPMLLDNNLRRLVGHHIHHVRKWGGTTANVREWLHSYDQCDKSKGAALESEYKFDKEIWSLYHSADAHTVKKSVPAKVYITYALTLLIPLMLIGTGYFFYRANKSAVKVVPQPVAVIPKPDQKLLVTKDGNGHVQTAQEYIQDRQPRIAGLPHTAPVYDGVTKVTRAPVPTICISSDERCTCYTDQATKIGMADFTCRSIALGGYFHDFDNRDQRNESATVSKSAAPSI